jgi:acetyl esterase/lipase
MLRVLLVVLTLNTAALAQGLPAEIFDTDQPYGDHPRQVIDVAARPLSTLKPAILVVHGGDWQAGDKRSAANKVRFFLGEGFALASMNYRLHPNVTPAEQAEDVAAAAVWLARNADRYGIDPRQIYIAGHEAGAHLAALVATDPRYFGKHGARPADIGGIVLIDGPVFDIPTEMAATSEETAEGRTLRRVFGSDERRWPDLSPAYKTSEADSLPAFFVIQSAGLENAYRQAKPFLRALRQEGAIAVPYEAVARNAESIFRFFGTEGDPATEALITFVRREANIPVARAEDGRTADLPPVPWSFAFSAPEEDQRGMSLTGTQITEIVTHDARLFAGNAYPRETDVTPRGQVFRLDAAEDRWQLDLQMPRGYVKAASLAPARFEKDSEGRPIEPLDYLFVGAKVERGEAEDVPAGIFIRTPSGNWTKQDLGLAPGAGSSEVSALVAYRDPETGQDHIFAGASPAPHGIYRGTYDAAATGGIRFDDAPEFAPRAFETVIGFTSCRDTLYAATSRAILMRKNGERPSWEMILDLQDLVAFRPYLEPLDVFWQREWSMGSFRCDESRAKPTLAFTALGRAFRFSPGDDLPVLETSLAGLIQNQLGRKPHFVTAGQATTVRQRGRDLEEWIGLEVYYDPNYIASMPGFPHWRTGFGKDGLYVVRTVIGGQTNYRIESINVPGLDPNRRPFARVMDFEISPFNRDHAIYAGGFAPWFEDVSNTAWMTRGEL